MELEDYVSVIPRRPKPIPARCGEELKAKAPLAPARGSDAPDPTCPSCEGRGKRLVGYTGYGVAMFQQCPFCQGTGFRPVQPNDKAQAQPPDHD